MKNKFGLGRDIPSDVRRAVRQRDGFGCVICGNAFIKYEHLEPEFHEAKEHETEGIVLLCGGCENKRTKKVLSVDTIKRHARNPRARQIGFTRESMDIGITHPEIIVGTLVGRNCHVVLRANGEDILSIMPPEEAGAPYRLSALIRDRRGKKTLEIVENEWRASTDNWDVETIGQRLIIRRGPAQIAMIVRVDPPNRIIFERLDYAHQGARIFVEPNQEFIVVTSGGSIFRSGGLESDGSSCTGGSGQ